MGTTSSSTNQRLTQEQKDIHYLGERMPFGDEELRLLYRCYHVIERSPDRRSFFLDWGVCSILLTEDGGEGRNSTSSSSSYETKNERRIEREGLLQIMEERILPRDFGNHLYARVFLVGGESVYDQPPSIVAKGGLGKEEEEDLRLGRLEAFFHGISNCGRRGARSAAKVYVACCDPVDPSSSKHSNSMEPMIRALDLIRLGYRVGLANAFLEASSRSREDDNDEEDGQKRTSLANLMSQLPQYLPAETAKSEKVLEAFAESLVSVSRRRRLRMGLPPTPQQQEAEKEGWVDTPTVLEWAEEVAPLFGATLSTFVYRLFFPGKAYPPSQTEFGFPRIPKDSAFFESASSPLLFSLACLSPALKGTFYRLYTSLSDGLSFNRLQNALLGYGGPTLLVIRSTENEVFGAFTGSSWKESKDFYGTSDCFLFQLLPKIAVYRPTGNSRNFMYCNSYARTRGYDNQAHGIGFGGTTDEPRLFIAEDWDNCLASSRDMTFENGPLLGGQQQQQRKRFELESLEVWGVGGDEVVHKGLGSQAEARKIKDAAIAKARKVDKAAFLDDFRSGVLESKAFKHQEQIQGRAECDLEDLRKEQQNRQ